MRQSRLIATVTHVRTLIDVGRLLGEDLELLEAIVSNNDNLTYGNIISVYTGSEESLTTLTDGGIEELKNMLADAKRSEETWNDFLDTFVEDPDVIARVKNRVPR